MAASNEINTSEPYAGDRIILSFAQAGHEHLFAYFPLKQPFVQLTIGDFDDREPAISPDGTKVVFSSSRGGAWDLYLLDLSSGEVTQLTHTLAYDGAPSWSPDGQWLTYETYNGSNFDIIVMPALDPAVPSVQLTQNSGNNFSPDWSPGGREIVFTSDRSGSNELWIARLDVVDDRFVRVLGKDDADYSSPVWSPDGSSLAWTKTQSGVSTIEAAPVTDIGQKVVSYGPGSNPVWSQDGTALLVQLSEPNASYLAAYRVSDGTLLFPAEYFPSPIDGADWRTATLVNTLPPADPQPERDGVSPLYQTVMSESNFAERQSLAALDEIKAPYPYLLPAAKDSFTRLRSVAAEKLGWDFLASLDDAALPISAPPQPGIIPNWLYTGRAINVQSAPLSAGWMTIAREEYDGRVYWRLWVKCFNQDGSCGEPQKAPIWDFSSRYLGDGASYEEGGKLGNLPAGYWIDFTNLALEIGWERMPAMSNWRNYFQGTLFNQFVFRQGLSWSDAMLQLYPSDVVSSIP
jgi:TolB protein